MEKAKSPVTLLLATDHDPKTRAEIARLVAAVTGKDSVAAVGNYYEAIPIIDKQQPAIIVISKSLPLNADPRTRSSHGGARLIYLCVEIGFQQMVMAGEERYKPCIILFANESDEQGQVPEDNVEAVVKTAEALIEKLKELWDKLTPKNSDPTPDSH